MADRGAHVAVGGLVGIVAAAGLAREQDPNAGWEVLGGVFGGVVGGRLPDVFDPPTSPNHRALGHGVLPVGGGALKGGELVKGWQAHWRDLADHYAQQWARERDPNARMWLGLQEVLCRMVAGAIPGLMAGYIAHLAMDAGTPRGLPLLGIGGT